MKIALVIGHRKGSQGAYGNCGISEWKFNNKLVKEILAHPLVKGCDNEFEVFYRTDGGSGYTSRMKELHSRIDKWGARVSLSFHFNAASNPKVNGHEVLYHSSHGEYYAELLNNQFNYFLHNKDRGTKYVSKGQRGGGFLARGKSYCILAEPFFSSNQCEYNVSGKYRENLVLAYATFLSEI